VNVNLKMRLNGRLDALLIVRLWCPIMPYCLPGSVLFGRVRSCSGQGIHTSPHPAWVVNIP